MNDVWKNKKNVNHEIDREKERRKVHFLCILCVWLTGRDGERSEKYTTEDNLGRICSFLRFHFAMGLSKQ
jgi:hypothetical protein